MKASMGFGLGGHDRFLIPFILHAMPLDDRCDVGDSIISLYATRVGRIADPTYMA